MSRKTFYWSAAVCLCVLLGGFSYLFFFRHQPLPKPPIESVLETASKEVARSGLLPDPLRRENTGDGYALTRKGVLAATNSQRAGSRLKPLKENALLNAAAEAKLADMLKNQYFAHESPNGDGAAELAQAAGYSYLLIGENLALGDFEGDPGLVQAWMDSPGHRANIMSGKYAEIGIAVGEGVFEGEKTWLAVQEFGVPTSACPDVNYSVEILIASNKKQLSESEKKLEAQQQKVAATTPKNGPEYNREAAEYNRMVEEYNDLVARTKKLIAEYSDQVEVYNRCLRTYTN